MSYRSIAAVAAAAILAAAGSAHATLFSFASDTNDQLTTFLGTAGSSGSFNINDRGPTNRFTLLIDDNNGPAAAFARTVRFEADLRATWVSSPTIFGTTVQHIYTVTNGTQGFAFRFVDPTDNAVLLTASLDASTQGVFSVPGTATSWSTTGAVLGSDSFANVRYIATQALVDRMTAAGFNPATYGIAAGDSVGPDDFGFDLTRLFQRGSISTGVALDPQTRLPTQGWEAEGSFSGSAVNGFIPAPGAMGLLAIGGLVASRRRRSA